MVSVLALLLLAQAPGEVGEGPQTSWVEIATRPEGATLIVNGQHQGRSPVRMLVPTQSTLSVLFEKDGFENESRLFFVTKPNERWVVALRVTETEERRREVRRRLHEWVSFGLFDGWTFGGSTVLGATLRLGGLRIGPVFVNLLEGHFGRRFIWFGPELDGLYLYAGGRIGGFVYLDQLSQHEIRVSVGLGVEHVAINVDRADLSVGISPAMAYNFRFDSGFSLGYTFRAQLSAARDVGRPGMIQSEITGGYSF